MILFVFQYYCIYSVRIALHYLAAVIFLLWSTS